MARGFEELFVELTGNPPFPWQRALYERLLGGDIPRELDIPTGLGKTSVMAIWLIARATGAELPRRLVYVVDRRAVVDQATTVADRLRASIDAAPDLRDALALDDQSLRVSTLRGQHLDNRAWLEDPSAPAVVVGTVDMVGSRLLFEGYGVSRKMRPIHAGVLGVDTLFVLDEAHLVPPFERLLESVASARERGLGPADEVAALVPATRLLSLSATGRSTASAFTLGEADHEHPGVKERVRARKVIELRPAVAKGDLAARLAEEAYGAATRAAEPARIVVFCDTRDDATKVADGLRKLSTQRRGAARGAGVGPPEVELFVGGRRAYERERLADWLAKQGFIAGSQAPAATTFLVATSAAEVGVDLDADAAVADVVAWERMVQRLGRVNRRGKSTSKVVLIPLADDERAPDRREACLALLGELPQLDGGLDGSPAALSDLRGRAARDPRIAELVERATTPAPLHPPLGRALVDAWAMTSLETHTGRPEVDPWLRGWVDDDEPQVTVAFRAHLPVIDGQPFDPKTLQSFLDVAGPHAAEELEVEVRRALDWLVARVAATTDAIHRGGGVDAGTLPLALALGRGRESRVVTRARLLDKRERARLERLLAGGRLLVDVRVGGLVDGMLSVDAAPGPEMTLDLTQGADTVPFRVRRVDVLDDLATGELRLDKEFVIERDAEGEPAAWLVVERRASEPVSEAGRSIARRAQPLEEHQRWTEDAAAEIAARLGLPSPLAHALAVAARLHDEGKRAERWQRAFHVPGPERPLAKSTRAPNVAVLGGYRHELGSLRYVERDPGFLDLDENQRELVLHLVAAHHGRARPNLPVDGAEEPPTRLRERAREVALRFERLSRRFGPWGLAWLESLLRAADARASRRNDDEVRHG